MFNKSIVPFLFFPAFWPANTVSSQDFKHITIRVNGGIEYVIQDPSGLRAGINPFLGQRYVEINDSYGVHSIDSEDPNIDPPEPVNEFETFEPVDGSYEITLFGTKPSAFTLYVLLARSMMRGDRKAFDIVGVIDSGNTLKYEIEYSSTTQALFHVSKTVRSGTLRQDFENCYKLNLLGQHPLYQQLDARIRNYERHLERGDSSKAGDELVKFDKELDRIRNETIKHEQRPGRKDKPPLFLTEDAYTILKEDVAVLLGRR